MKKLLFLIALIVLSSCSNESEETTSLKSLQGRWQWTGSNGGIMGTTETPDPDNVIVIEFSGSTYKTFRNGTLTSEKPFEIKKEPSIFGEDRPMIISTNPDQYFIKMSFSFEGSNLILSQECHDCFASGYIRIK